MNDDFDLDIDVPPNPKAQTKSVDATLQQQAAESNAVDLPDIDINPHSEVPAYVVEPDAKKLAVKFGIIGSGQGGVRLADTFWQIGYRRVCGINTTPQDFLGLSLPNEKRMVLKAATNGAGKNPAKGREALTASTEEVLNLMRHSFGEDIERIMITVGCGGGCIDSNEFVLTATGPRKASDLLSLVDDQVPTFETETGYGFQPSENIYVASANTITGKQEWKKVNTIWDVHKKPTCLVSMDAGSLQCSEDHIFFVYDPVNDSFIEKMAKDLHVDVLLYQYDSSDDLKYGEDIDSELMWLLGYFAGNGNFKLRVSAPKTNPHTTISCVRYDDADRETLEKVEHISSRMNSTSTNISVHQGQNSFILYVYGEDYFHQIRDHYKGPIPKGGQLGRLPEIVVSASKRSFIAYLAGVISSDGHIRKGRSSIDIAMIDIDFVRELGLLASIHGFTTSFSIKTTIRSNEKPLGRLHLFDLTEEQQQDLGQHLLPIQTDVLYGHKKSRSSNVVEPKFKDVKHLFSGKPKPSDYVRNTYQVSKRKFASVYASLLRRDCLYKKIFQNLYPVKTVEKLPEQKFIDFTIDDNHNYFAGTDRLYLVHNSGTGSAIGLFKLAKYYMQNLGKEPKVGMIVTLPKKTEGGKVQGNAYRLMQDLKILAESKALSPFVIVDNESIHQMFPTVSAKHFWTTANRNTVGLFDIFNVLACQQSEYVTFDAADYGSVLDSGVLVYGATKLDSYGKDTDISDGLRTNLKRTLLADADITEATHVAAILCAPDKLLGILPQAHIDLAFATLERIMGGENRDLMVHQGVYEAKKMGLYLYTIVGGLSISDQRLNLMKAKAGLFDEEFENVKEEVIEG